ncbi:winged helix-turn-helix transcriptional regulator [Lactiplantibacillus pentosus]|uniref:winged helix-turn-helix transcriptional regulator n=1 Tax=Lactiplantibacillus pentosus TaxID=1589 RepID=UPI0021A7965B|nr:helix-turn-helix domain-containing protein [Lactiplantibacillus pentosus]MCT3063571.1 transcriptional regulator [Lactiplantibacillus pentosus]
METAISVTRHNEVCPLDVTINIIDGKWKSIILCRLMSKELRHSELLHSLSGCTRRMLSLQLADLIRDHIVYKTIDATCAPIKTTYHLTKLGTSLIPLIKAMDTWGEMYLNTI